MIQEKQQTDMLFNNIPLVKELREKVKELEEKCTEIACNKQIEIMKLRYELKEKNLTIKSLEEKIK